MSSKSLCQLTFELESKVGKKQITEDEAVRRLLLAAEGGLTPFSARRYIRNPVLWDERPHGGGYWS